MHGKTLLLSPRVKGPDLIDADPVSAAHEHVRRLVQLDNAVVQALLKKSTGVDIILFFLPKS